MMDEGIDFTSGYAMHTAYASESTASADLSLFNPKISANLL
jgi:hypothetical protein